MKNIMFYLPKYFFRSRVRTPISCNMNQLIYNTNQGFAELCVYNARHSLASYTKHKATPTRENYCRKFAFLNLY